MKLLRNRRPLLKNREIRQNIRRMKVLFNKYNVTVSMKNELDYYNACMCYQGIINKETYEKVYEDNRQDLIDLWDTIDRNRRNFFSNKALDNYRDSMPYFICKESVCRMPMLEKLFNDLYEKELTILELPQYFKFKTVFNKNLVDPFDEYFDLPYKNNFIEVEYIWSDDNNLAIYENINNNIYIINRKREITAVQLKKGLNSFNDVSFVKAIIDQNEENIMRLIIENDYTENKVKEKVIKLERKNNEK